MSKSKKNRSPSILERLEFAVIRAILGVVHLMPYRRRIAAMGWVMQRVIAPVAGYTRRVRENLALVVPEVPENERNALVGQISNNIGRMLGELFSPDDLVKLAHDVPLAGPGLPAIEEAMENGRPVIFVSGHFGNYDVMRAALIKRGFNVGALYRRMNNPLFHDYYLNNISTIGTPLFERGRSGFGQMLRHLKKGGALAALIDVRAGEGVPLTFFGKPAWTALGMAELALRYDALFVPVFAIRQADGISYKAHVDVPIPHGDPAEMVQAYNDKLESQVRQNMAQWFWFHRRWKVLKHMDQPQDMPLE